MIVIHKVISPQESTVFLMEATEFTLSFMFIRQI